MQALTIVQIDNIIVYRYKTSKLNKRWWEKTGESFDEKSPNLLTDWWRKTKRVEQFGRKNLLINALEKKLKLGENKEMRKIKNLAAKQS